MNAELALGLGAAIDALVRISTWPARLRRDLGVDGLVARLLLQGRALRLEVAPSTRRRLRAHVR